MICDVEGCTHEANPEHRVEGEIPVPGTGFDPLHVTMHVCDPHWDVFFRPGQLDHFSLAHREGVILEAKP